MTDIPSDKDEAFEKKQLDPLILEMEAQNERGAAIVGGAIVEDRLKTEILAQWPPMSNTMHDRLFTGYGPLSSFSAKIDLAFVMNLISTGIRQDAHHVRHIRNCAAHIGQPFAFDQGEVKKHIDQLLIPKHLGRDEIATASPARNSFTVAVRIISVTVAMTRIFREKYPKAPPFDPTLRTSRDKS